MYKYGEYDPYGKQNDFAHPQMYEMFDLENDPYGTREALRLCLVPAS